MARIVWRAVLWALAGFVAIYAMDWAMWQVRVLARGGYRTVAVDRFAVAPLKSGKEEYYPDGRIDVRCSVSLLPQAFPQAVSKPCWWVERHPVVFER